MEPYIPISFLNDFIFCPRSIYYHRLYSTFDSAVYHRKPQIAGKAAHRSIEKGRYSTRKDLLRGLAIYSERYRLCGKIDLFNVKKGCLTERKRQIRKIYDGYIFQVYAQYYGLTEMGYEVKKITLYDLCNNKTYLVKLPSEDIQMHRKFENVIAEINKFELDDPAFVPNHKKCRYCIYMQLCDYGLC